ncbi:MAG: hypothetical protein J5993_01835 [Clostridia bacterium]|nr:hypothetical protein [Clostridia bacterium]
MIATVSIVAITCIAIILSILFFPKIRLGKFSFDTYWVVSLAGATILLAFRLIDPKETLNAIVADSEINPLKILVLFISMTLISVYLDETGFFCYLASVVLKRAKTDQRKLLLALYVIVSLLTIVTSNDIIILSFTPLICYFAKNAKIDPMPYLFSEFVAANTWSMTLVIGNPTNIYLATAYLIPFLSYTGTMLLPTIASGLVSLSLLFFLYRKKLAAPICAEEECETVKDKTGMIVGLVHLAVCTLLLAVGSYANLPMWIVSLVAAMSLFLWVIGRSLVGKRKPTELIRCLKRAPWQLIPFVLSMFVMILALSAHGVTQDFSRWLGEGFVCFKYGVASFFISNVINNIPMSVLFSSVLESLQGQAQLQAVYATIVGSNIGAFFTPIGALAGIMWSSILKKHDLKFSFLDFVKTGGLIAIPSLAVSLGALALIV